jgi:hypothetical protein
MPITSIVNLIHEALIVIAMFCGCICEHTFEKNSGSVRQMDTARGDLIRSLWGNDTHSAAYMRVRNELQFNSHL